MPQLFGEHDRHLAQIEEELDVEISARGNELIINGEKLKLKMAQTVFDILWDRLTNGLTVDKEDVSAALQVALSPLDKGTRAIAKAALKEPHLKAKNKTITPRTPKQKEYLDAIKNKTIWSSVSDQRVQARRSLPSRRR